MKNRFIFKITLVFTLILISTLIFTSCSLLKNNSNEKTISNAMINDKGELVVVYSNGLTQSLGVVVGKDGKDGINGTNGIDGKDGVDGNDGEDGTDGKDGADGEIIIQGGNNSASLTSAIANSIQSAVVIQCGFDSKLTLETEIDTYSNGAGVFYKVNKEAGSAFIITNYHVVFNKNSSTANGISDNIDVFLYGHLSENQAIKAKYIGGSMQYDLALLQITDSEIIKSSDIKPIQIRSSDEVHVGESVFAIGNPKSDGFSVSAGIISTDSETIEMTAADEKSKINIRVMRTDAAINAGNSGGGLFDENGKLIGIVNAKYVDSSIDNIGYAIPTRTAVAIIENIMYNCLNTDTECVKRPLLGITVQIQNPRAVYNKETGFVDLFEDSTVISINEGSIAEGNLQIGDILRKMEISGTTNSSVNITRQYMIEELINARLGDTVTITVERNGELVDISFIITEECITEC